MLVLCAGAQAEASPPLAVVARVTHSVQSLAPISSSVTGEAPQRTSGPSGPAAPASEAGAPRSAPQSAQQAVSYVTGAVTGAAAAVVGSAPITSIVERGGGAPRDVTRIAAVIAAGTPTGAEGTGGTIERSLSVPALKAAATPPASRALESGTALPSTGPVASQPPSPPLARTQPVRSPGARILGRGLRAHAGVSTRSARRGSASEPPRGASTDARPLADRAAPVTGAASSIRAGVRVGSHGTDVVPAPPGGTSGASAASGGAGTGAPMLLAVACLLLALILRASSRLKLFRRPWLGTQFLLIPEHPD